MITITDDTLDSRGSMPRHEAASGEIMFSLKGGEPIEFTFKLRKAKDRRVWADVFMLKGYKRTEMICPRKKKRGTIRRRRREKRNE